jgi:PAS domain S-box-containing protein
MQFNINKWLKLQIRGKLATAFAGLSILPVLVIGYLGISSNVRSLRQIAVESLNHDLVAIKERVAAFFQGFEDNLHFIAASSSFQRFAEVINEADGRMASSAKAELLPELVSFAQRKNIFYQIKFISRKGKEAFVVERRRERYQVLPDDELNRYDTLFYLYLAEEIPPNQATFIPVELRGGKDRSLFPAISCIYPVHQPELAGLLVLQIYAQSFFAIIEQETPHSPTGTVMLVNAEGHYLYHSEKKKDWNQLLAAKDTQNLKSDYGEQRARVLLSGDSDLIHEVNGELVAHAPIFSGHSGFDSDYMILKSVPQAEIFAPVNTFKKIFFGFTGFFLLVSLFLAYLATRQFTEPIQKLRREAEVIAKGDYHSRVNVQTYDEIEALAHQFNIMAGSLEKRDAELAKHREQLEQMVQARTQELQDEKSKLQAILDNVPSAFIMLDKNFRIKSASAALYNLTGHRFEEVRGKLCYEVFGRSELCLVCPSRRAFNSGRMESEVTPSPDPQANQRFFEHIAVPIKRNGHIESILEIITDITERKRLQEQMIRTEKLSATGEMAAVIAHEMRNSLTSVKLILQFLAESQTASSAEKDSVKVAVEAIHQMESVVNELLNFARPTPTKLTTKNLNEILRESITLSRHQLDRKRLRLVEDLSPEVPEMKLDADHLKEVFINLILNATQAVSEKGEIRITTRVCRLSHHLSDYFDERKAAITLKKGRQVIQIEVTDNGCGIPPENLPRIFDPFFTTKIDGTGLGLAMAKRVINEHGGVMTVGSELHKGTTFTIVLPCRNH